MVYCCSIWKDWYLDLLEDFFLSSSIEVLQILKIVSLKREDQSQGVVIKLYHTDNGIFNKLEFMEGLLNKQKQIRFSGDGASHKMGRQSAPSIW